MTARVRLKLFYLFMSLTFGIGFLLCWPSTLGKIAAAVFAVGVLGSLLSLWFEDEA